MNCPSCNETIGGSGTACPACGAALVDTRPGPPADPTIQLTTIFSAGDPAVIALAQSLLEDEGIEFIVRAEGVQDLFGWGRIGAGYNIITGPAEFVVREDDAARARAILHDLEGPGAR